MTTAPLPPARPRVDVLAYPPPTGTRFVLVITSLLTAGLFIGTWVHNSRATGAEWARTAASCSQEAFGTPPDPSDPAGFARQEEYVTCMASAERTRAAYSGAGLAVAALSGLAVMYATPVIKRRNRGLVPAKPELAGAVDRLLALSVEAGVRPPRLVVGDSRLRQPFSFGTPTRLSVAVPRGLVVRWRRAEVFDPPMRHELAHVAAGDVPLSSITQSLWYALTPLLLLPVALQFGPGDWRTLGDYVWRAGLLAVAALLAARAALRSREFDADVRSVARMPERRASLLALFQSQQPVPQTWRSRLLGNHPDLALRARMVERPELITRVTFLDGLVAAFLVAVSVPLVSAVLSTLLATVGATLWANVLVAATLGPLLGSTVGLALWRQSLVARVTGSRPPVMPVAAGVAVGLMVGQLASLGRTGLFGRLEHLGWVVVGTVLLVGATYVVSGLGELWADVAPLSRSPRPSWLAAVLTSSAAFAVVVWLVETLRQGFEGGGWLMASGVLAGLATGAVPALLSLVLAAAVGVVVWLGRRPGMTPAWLVEGGEPLPWPRPDRRPGLLSVVTGITAGLAAASVALIWHLVTGGVDVPEDYYGLLWAVAGAAGAAGLAVSLLVPRRGAGLVLLSGAVAALIGSVGLLGIGLLSTGRLDGGLVETAMVWPLGLALPVAVAAAPAAIASGRLRASGLLVAVTGGALSAVVAVAAVSAPTVLAPFSAAAPRTGTSVDQRDLDVLVYIGTHDRAVARLGAASQRAQELLGGAVTEPLDAADRLTAGPIAELDALHEELSALEPRDPAAGRAHVHLLAVIDLQGRLLGSIVMELRTGEPDLTDRRGRLQRERDERMAQLLAAEEALSRRLDPITDD